MAKKVIAVINQKGGVGKSTTAAAMAAGLALKGYKVLAVDLDAQCNLSYIMGASQADHTALELLEGKATVTHTSQGDIIPGNGKMAAADLLLTEAGKEYRIKEALAPLDYDYIILDTPPALGVITVNALVASDDIIIPAQADILSIQGIVQLARTIKPVKQYYNPGLNIAGILLTRYSPRSVLTKSATDTMQSTAAQLSTIVFNATIREAVAIKEAQASQTSIFTYDNKSKVANDYMAFIDEYLKGAK